MLVSRIGMALHLYPNIHASGSVPQGWKPSQKGTLKYKVANKAVLRELRRMLAGRWKKVIKMGAGGEVHYFEHKSGQVAGVKFYPEMRKS
jgi:hypothetical protein